MSALHEIQAAFGDALLGNDASGILRSLAGDGIRPEARLDIYRNNVMVSLKDVLKSAFPVVCKLVGEGFFLYATDEFIRRHPPRRPCLDEYGDRLADFLAAFPPCGGLAYLPDVARLEWRMHAAAVAPDAEPIAPSAMAGLGAQNVADIWLTLDPSLGLLQSPWPVDRIWQANQRGCEDRTVDLDAGGVRLEIRRDGDDVVFRALEPPTFVFRSALAEGGPIVVAAESALAIDPAFDLAAALRDLFQEGAVVGFTTPA